MDGSSGKAVIVPVEAALGGLPAAGGVVVAGSDAAAVGEAVRRLRARGVDACGYVGAASDPAAAEMAAELFPGLAVEVRGTPR